jgi:hypothetical protein
MDGLWIIVCAGADLGEEESSTQGLEHARKVRREYYSAKTNHELQVYPLDRDQPAGEYDVN